MSLHKLAQQVRTKGRHGDTELVHMTPSEVAGLHKLARAMGASGLSTNPETGLHEAFSLKSLLPTLIGGAVGGFTGSNALGSLAGAAVGGYQARKGGGENTLAGMLSGGMGGYGASQLAQGFSAAAQQGLMNDAMKEAAGAQAAAAAGDESAAAAAQAIREKAVQAAQQAGFLDKAKAGISALMTEQGRDAASKAVSNPLQAIGRAAMPLGMVDPAAQEREAAAHRPGGNYTSPYAGGTGKWSYDEQGILRWVPGKKQAAGGTVGYADGGVLDEGNEGENVTSDAVFAYLMGQGEDPRVNARRTKLAAIERNPAGSGWRGAEGAGALEPGAVSGFDDLLSQPSGNGQGSAGDSEVGDVDISGGNGLGYANSNWEDPNGPDPGSSLGWMGSIIGDPGNASGSGLTPTGEAMSDLGSMWAQLQYDYPTATMVGGKIVDSVTGLPIVSAITSAITAAMNADPTNKNGLNAVNGMDKDSDDARQAAANAQETQRLQNQQAQAGYENEPGDTYYMNDSGAAGTESGFDSDYSFDSGGLGGDYSGWAGGDFSGGDYGDFGDAGGFGGYGGGVDFSGSGGWGGGGGGGGGGGCVQVDSILSCGRRAGDIKVGDKLELADADTLAASTGTVSYSERKVQPGWKLEAGGVTLICSASAPIPTRNGLKTPPELLHEHVAVQYLDGEAGWYPVKAEPIGDIEVQHITVDDKCFWAGRDGEGFILHHNKYIYDYEMAAGGPVALQSGGFVIPADVVSAVGAGSSSAGLEALAKRFGARPVQGKGHGQSDDIEATIDGKQPARVARDEMVLDAEQVARIGGGNPEKGAKKLYDMMQRVRKQATGSSKQMRVVNVNKVLS